MESLFKKMDDLYRGTSWVPPFSEAIWRYSEMDKFRSPCEHIRTRRPGTAERG